MSTRGTPACLRQVEARIRANLDRKSHPGVYTLFTSEPGKCTKGSRHTAAGAKPSPQDVGQEGEYFTDFFGFTYAEVGSGCSVASCSESQGPSLCDFSTNFCNTYAATRPPPRGRRRARCPHYAPLRLLVALFSRAPV